MLNQDLPELATGILTASIRIIGCFGPKNVGHEPVIIVAVHAKSGNAKLPKLTLVKRATILYSVCRNEYELE